MIQCERGHFYDENRFSGCPYCSQVSSQPKSVLPPVAPANMAIPQPSCGKTVAIEGMETEPQISKTVAIENFEENTPHVNKTVAIFEESSGLPSVGTPETPVAPSAPAAPVIPVPAASSAPEIPAPSTPAPADVPVPAPSVIPSMPDPTVPDSHTNIPFNGVSEEPERILTEDISVDIPTSLPVTGLGVTEHPEPLAQEENFYTPSDRPYAVTGLGVKENPTPIPVDVGATFPIPAEGGNAAPAAQPGQAEAAAFAAFGFPGGPIPGMMPGMPAPGAPIAPVAPVAPAAPEVPVDLTAPAETPVEAPVDAPVTAVTEEAPAEITSIEETPAVTEETPAVTEETPVAPVEEVPAAPVEEAPAAPVEEIPAAPVEEAPSAPVEGASAATAPMFVAQQAPRDPNATVSLTESDMDFIPRVHARAFLVCIDGPMTGASFVFQEKRAIIGRQKNYEIALFRDNSVSRSPHAILSYDKDAIRYTVSCGDADKRVMVNGAFINGETELKLYDVIGVGQSRLMFIPVCSDKFAW